MLAAIKAKTIELLPVNGLKSTHLPAFVRLDTVGALQRNGAAEALGYTRPLVAQGAKIR